MTTDRSRAAHVLALALLAVGCSAPPPKPPPAPPPASPAPPPAPAPTAAAPRPKLVVLLVVDQLPSWTFSRHVESFRGGFARLVREGVFWPRGEYPYAATITAIGHTALATGAEPHRTGIVGNSWWGRAEGRWIDATEDPAHLTVPPMPKDDGASAHARQVDAIGAGRRVLSMSYKERAAVLMAPSQGALAAWYEPEQRAFVQPRLPRSAPRVRRSHERTAAAWRPPSRPISSAATLTDKPAAMARPAAGTRDDNRRWSSASAQSVARS
jgi:hypothetical protein